MDFARLLQTHRESGADATIAVLPVPEDQTPGLGLVRVDDSGRVLGFVEKPKKKEQLTPIRMPPEFFEKRGIQAHGREYLASMGIYLFGKEALIHVLNQPPLATDFGKEVFPRSLGSHHVHTYLFDGYWEDVGTVKAYHEANLGLCGPNPPFDFHSPEGVIYTHMRYLPASRLNAAHLMECLVSDGCVVQAGARIERTVLGLRTRIGRNSHIRNSVLIGADHYETDAERADNRRRGLPDLGIGESCFIEGAILDKDCRVGHRVRITAKEGAPDYEGENYVIRDGIVVIPKGATVGDDTVI
jgi:glucose-1-phosphate adenylyltransferase